MAIDLNTLFTSLGIVSGNTQSKDQYEFYNGIVWDDATITYNQKEFFDKVGLSRYDFFKQYGDERSFYDNVDDTRITNMRNFYQYAGEYLAGADPQIPATAGFSADATQSVANTTIIFTNTSTGTSPITYAWDFGDGATSSSTNPTHSYSATGSYTITLTASNAFGTDDEVKTGYIQIGDLVGASFSSSTYSTAPDTVITFTDTSTGNPTSWAWDFGDGNIDVTQNPTHSYSATGSYVVTMTASSVYDTDSTSVGIEVVSAGPPPPVCTPGQVQIADYSTDLLQWEVTLCSVSDSQEIALPGTPTSGNYSGVSWQVSFSGVAKTTMFKIYLGSNANYNNIQYTISGGSGTFLADFSGDDSTLLSGGVAPGDPVNINAEKGGYIWVLVGKSTNGTYNVIFELVNI